METGKRGLDSRSIRKDFPIFERMLKGRSMAYLDSAATTQKPQAVIEAIVEYYRTYNANVHRGIYTISEEATQRFEVSRDAVAKFINAPAREGVVFTRNTTESINLVAQSWGRANLKPGDEILLTQMEHHSNLIPWQLIAGERGAKLRFVPLTRDGRLDLEQFWKLLSEKTRLVSLAHVSNVLGTINPVSEVVRRAHEVGAVVMVDGAQSVPHRSVDVRELDCDFLAFSGHKMLGPTGIGVLYGRVNLLDAMPPYMGGGEMISEVRLESATYRELPWKFEAGTPNIAGAIGLGAAVEYLAKLGMENVRANEEELVRYALDRIESFDDVETYGPRPDRGGVVAFNVKGVHPHDVSTVLDEDAVFIRAGHHCAQPLMRWLDVPATVRASFYVYSTEEEIDRLMESLGKVREVFNNVAAQ